MRNRARAGDDDRIGRIRAQDASLFGRPRAQAASAPKMPVRFGRFGLNRFWRVLAAVGLVSAAAVVLGHPAHAAVHRAGLVIEHAGGRLVTRCVTFMEDQISGFALIQRSGISYQAQSYGSMGEAICQLDGEPSRVPANCFGTGPYWQYLHRAGTRWVPSQLGASGWMLRDGDMDGWHYTDEAGQTLPALTMDQVCVPPPRPAASAPSGSTLQPTSAPTLSPSLSLSPSSSPVSRVPFPTATPTARPKPPFPSSAARPLSVLGGSLLVLAGLSAWNLMRRGP